MNKLALGTVQFGLDYGIKNTQGKLPSKMVDDILSLAHKNGINTIDTAQGYGESESVIGDYLNKHQKSTFDIITKVSTINDYEDIEKSFNRIGKDYIYGVLMHNFDLYKSKPEIYNILKEYRDGNRIGKIGFSVYNPEDINYLVDQSVDFDIVQIPYSIFDRRFESCFPLLAKNNIEVHVRSVFLQGLFFLNPKNLSSHFDSVKDKIYALQKFSKESGLSIASICLNYVVLNDYIDKVVIGVDNPNELIKNLEVLNEQNEIKNYLVELNKYQVEDVNIICPQFWKK